MIARTFFVLLLVLLVRCGVTVAAEPLAGSRPNIVMVLTDDK